jgi:hypothetical protein
MANALPVPARDQKSHRVRGADKKAFPPVSDPKEELADLKRVKSTEKTSLVAMTFGSHGNKRMSKTGGFAIGLKPEARSGCGFWRCQERIKASRRC